MPQSYYIIINKPENPFQNYDLATNLKCQYKFTCTVLFFSYLTIRNAKTGNRTKNRIRDKPENFMDEFLCQYKFTCIEIFSIWPSEVQKPETGQETGSRTNLKILWMNVYVNTNSPASKIFRFDNQKYKNRKPDRKPDPGPEIFFTQKLRNYIMSLMPHNFFQLTESIKSFEANGA